MAKDFAQNALRVVEISTGQPLAPKAKNEAAVALGRLGGLKGGKARVEPPECHHVTSAEHAAQLVKSTGGVAFLTKRGAWRVAVDGLTIRPLSEPGLEVKTMLVARKDAGRLVAEFLRAVVRKIKQVSEPAQRTLPLAV